MRGLPLAPRHASLLSSTNNKRLFCPSFELDLQDPAGLARKLLQFRLQSRCKRQIARLID